jgi:hypothetical protein
MLTPQNRLRRKDEEVIAKVMDGEAVIINLANGMYYSLDNVGGLIWELLEDGCRLDEMTAVITARYEVASAQAQEDVLRLASHLLREDLVAIDELADRAPRATPPSQPHRSPYQSPQLQAFSDMEDLLALDPPTPGLADIPWKG